MLLLQAKTIILREKKNVHKLFRKSIVQVDLRSMRKCEPLSFVHGRVQFETKYLLLLKEREDYYEYI